jgi:uncharacterized protein YecT (DUF1311 family)
MLRRHLTAVLWLPLLMLAAGNASAGTLKCEELTSNAEMADCTRRLAESADAELNEVYKQAIESIRKAEHLTRKQRGDWEDAFRKAQRAWVEFKDTDCGEMVGWEWYQGSGMALTSWSCLLERTSQRTDEIRKRYLSE